MKHELCKISDRIYYMDFGPDTDRPNLGYIKGDKYSLMFDCGASAAHVEEYRRVLAENGLPFPDMAVLSHWHWDHALGMNFLGIPVIAGKETNEKLKEVCKWEWNLEDMKKRVESGEDILFCYDMVQREHGMDLKAIPRFRTADIVFEESLDIDLGGVICRIRHVGGPHSKDSVICYVPGEEFAFLSDSAGKDLFGIPWNYDPEKPEEAGIEMGKMPYDEEALNAYLAELAKYPFKNCIKGHEYHTSRDAFIASMAGPDL